jgi:hypothetical protein
MTADMPIRKRIFVSYSHKDTRLFEEFKTMLAPAIRSGLVDLWDDQKISPGANWKKEIQEALASASVAVLLVSQNFLASHFITEKELPPLLKAAGEEGVTIFWIYLSSCLVKQTEIASYQAAHDTSRPLDRLPKSQRQAVLSEVCTKLIQAAERAASPQVKAEWSLIVARTREAVPMKSGPHKDHLGPKRREQIATPLHSSSFDRKTEGVARIFISHSRKDTPLVEALVQLLEGGIGIRSFQIICSSLEEQAIPAGADFKRHIMEALGDAQVVVAVVTAQYYESAFCMCELGAAWALTKRCVPLLVPPVDSTDLRGSLFGTQAIPIDDERSLDTMHSVLQSLAQSPESVTRWNKRKSQFLKLLSGVLASLEQAKTSVMTIPSATQRVETQNTPPEKRAPIPEDLMGAVRQIRDQARRRPGAIKAFDTVHFLYLVSTDFSAKVIKTYEVRAVGEPLHFWESEISSADEADAAESFESICFRVRDVSGVVDKNVVYLPTSNELRRKGACIFFLPPVKPKNDLRKIEISYAWKGLLRRLAKVPEDLNFNTKVRDKMRSCTIEIYIQEGFEQRLDCDITGAHYPKESLQSASYETSDGSWRGKGYRYTVLDLPKGENRLTLRARLSG